MANIVPVAEIISVGLAPAAPATQGGEAFAAELDASIALNQDIPADILLTGVFPSGTSGARFTRLVPGAFHPATAFQKPMQELAANALPEPEQIIASLPVLQTHPASTTLLALLGQNADAELPEPNVVESAQASEPADALIAALPLAPITQLVLAPLPVVANHPEEHGQSASATKNLAAINMIEAPSIASQPDGEVETAFGAKVTAKIEVQPFERPSLNPAPKKATNDPVVQGAETSASQVPFGAPAAMVAAPAQETVSPVQTAAGRTHATPISQVPHVVALEARKLGTSGTHEFTIRLDPAELGRIDVKLEVKADGYVTAIVQADQASTYDLLRQDARGFEQCLTDSGLKTNADTLNFSLRREGESTFAQFMSGEQGHSARRGAKSAQDGSPLAGATESLKTPNHRLSLSQIDVMA